MSLLSECKLQEGKVPKSKTEPSPEEWFLIIDWVEGWEVDSSLPVYISYVLTNAHSDLMSRSAHDSHFTRRKLRLSDLLESIWASRQMLRWAACLEEQTWACDELGLCSGLSPAVIEFKPPSFRFLIYKIWTVILPLRLLEGLWEFLSMSFSFVFLWLLARLNFFYIYFLLTIQPSSGEFLFITFPSFLSN